MMDGRRELRFERIEDVMPEVERLLAGHATVKGWTLGQILYHLATAVWLCLDVRSTDVKPSAEIDLARTQKVRRRLFFRSDKFPEGQEIPLSMLAPPEDLDERLEADSLRLALGRLGSAGGPFAAHPVLGSLSGPEWLDFHRLHCAHHLSFARVVTREVDFS